MTNEEIEYLIRSGLDDVIHECVEDSAENQKITRNELLNLAKGYCAGVIAGSRTIEGDSETYEFVSECARNTFSSFLSKYLTS